MSKIVLSFLNNPLVKDNPQEPFEKDYSGKLKLFSENLTRFIANEADGKPLVLSLSAPYGLGKTALYSSQESSLQH